MIYRTQANLNDVSCDTVRRFTAAFAEAKGHRPGVYVRTFGCQQNEADSERYVGMAEALGYEWVPEPEQADLILYNTCAVREHAELKALSLTGQLKHLKAQNPNRILAICGCMVAQEHRLNDIKNRYPYVDFLFGTGSPEKFPAYLARALTKKGRGFYPDLSYGITEGLPIRRESRFKAWVSIMYGCNNFCTYCVVPYVRGRERSREREAILDEIRALVADGCREITLLGQNVNSYGKGLYEDYGFAELLLDICRIEGDYWIRFMTSHPKDASHKLIDVIAAHSGDDCRPKIVKQFHLPLQSGSDRILKTMNRHYDSASYLSLIEYMKKAIPDIALSTDIIVGFPTETEAEFEDTLRMLETVRYDAFFSFIYSIRRGTPAESMEQVPEDIKRARFARLLETQNRISREKNEDYLGKTERVLVEGRSKTDPNMLTGRNEKNRLVHFVGEDALIGCFASVRILAADTYCLTGELVR
ncbi:MAG: tRNA (N6-isopentenyl adenosine(37)-C2)-methylthiotransferase MiaB [Ruminococcaceae bacterium]|nr:tRNA (N6-isopentenyl adenosine(37)-C2)-methylthiotransferase MiaB [Oscillospiraceae bacterium]